MDKDTVCRSKVHYDSRFEAELGALESEDKFGEEMVPYQCWPMGHWHITHKDKSKRRGLGHAFVQCDTCGKVVKRKYLVDHKCKGTTNEQ